MEDNLIELLATFGYPVLRQGSLAENEQYPPTFFTFWNNGEWVPIDPEKTYTVACHNYLLQDMGDGYTMFTDNVYILDKVLIDNQVIINYICDFLGGNVGTEYAEPQGRITVI